MNKIQLNKDVIIKIYLYDSTFKLLYQKCINEIQYKIEIHNTILTTYNCVKQEDRIYFKSFSTDFYKYFFKNN